MRGATLELLQVFLFLCACVAADTRKWGSALGCCFLMYVVAQKQGKKEGTVSATIDNPK